MNIDDKVRKELQQDSNSFDELLNDDEGLFDLVKGSYQGGMRGWMVTINVVIIIVTGLMLWTGYQFFTSSTGDDYSFWGVCFLLSTYGQVAMKQWVWTEMNRCSLMREIKRLELAVARMSVELANK